MSALLADLCRGDSFAFTPAESVRYLRLRAERGSRESDANCRVDLQIGAFFDGTNNNATRDEPTWSHSNVVRLFNALPIRVGAIRTRGIYVPGVGTPFPEIGDTGEGTEKQLGLAMAWRAEQRIVWALLQSFNAVHQAFFGDGNRFSQPASDRTLSAALTPAVTAADYLKFLAGLATTGPLGAALTLADPLDTRRKRIDARRTAELQKMNVRLAAKIAPLIKSRALGVTIRAIRVSVFGFSRGAAEARAFTNWFIAMCRSSGGLTLGGVPVVIDFLGIFDTVASVGLAHSALVADGHMEWANAEASLRIPPEVGRCVHLVSAHEVRRSFPLDSVRVGRALPANCIEVVYPGVHSDVGGGYRPTEQGRGVAADGADMLSRIPLARMYREARLAGVPFDVDGVGVPASAKTDLRVDPATRDAFNAYLAECRVGRDAPAPLEEIMLEQSRLYVRWRKLRLGKMAEIPSVLRATPQDRADIVYADAEVSEELAELARPRGGGITPTTQAMLEKAVGPRWEPLTAKLLGLIGKWVNEDRDPEWRTLRSAWDEPGAPSAAVTRLFDDYVHDSRAWFKPLGTDDAEFAAAAERRAAAARLRIERRVANYKEREALAERYAQTDPKVLQRDGPLGHVPLSAAERADLARCEALLARPSEPEIQKAGREPFDLGGGYLRLRHVYYGMDTGVLRRRELHEEYLAAERRRALTESRIQANAMRNATVPRDGFDSFGRPIAGP